MSEQLYRWVKASEQPLELKQQGTKRSILYMGVPDTLICLIEDDLHWCWWKKGHGAHEKVKPEQWVNIQWLEPYTPSADVEQAAKRLYPDLDIEVLRSMNAGLNSEASHGVDIRQRKAEQAAFIAGAGYETNQEYEMKRLYDWIMDENRRKAASFFTEGWTRTVAREIERRIGKAGESK